MYIAKMVTKYPELKGEGYFNFLMNDDYDKLMYKVQEYSHDYRLSGDVIEQDLSQEELIEKYPTKYDLNRALFDGE